MSAPGYGTLRWPGRTDVRGVIDRLGEVVTLGRHSVTVYAGDAEKPEAGTGLNKHCIYTMENVWVRDRTTGDILGDVKSIATFRQQLQRKADRMGARMVDYDNQRGEWTIEVQHF